MTNYNDGNWHFWSGMTCPVHPMSVVDYVWHDENQQCSGLTKERRADSGIGWRQVIRFRVVKEYREPREFWVNFVGGRWRVLDAEPDRPHAYMRLREVLE